jgi:hypothetical protein
MAKVAILPEMTPKGDVSFHAFSGIKHSVGKTAGEALDSLTPLLPPEETANLVIVRSLSPDKFFTKELQDRLSFLMQKWRAVRDSGTVLLPDEEKELKGLVDCELLAAKLRAAALAKELES